MPHHGVTPHISGTSLSAQARYAGGIREILECWFEKRPIRNEYLIVDGGELAGAGAHSYGAGDATGGSEEAAKFKEPPNDPHELAMLIEPRASGVKRERGGCRSSRQKFRYRKCQSS
jgi:hypothetical protein